MSVKSVRYGYLTVIKLYAWKSFLNLLFVSILYLVWKQLVSCSSCLQWAAVFSFNCTRCINCTEWELLGL